MGACLSFPLLRTARAQAVRASTVTYTRVPDDGDSDVLIFPVSKPSVGKAGPRARHV